MLAYWLYGKVAVYAHVEVTSLTTIVGMHTAGLTSITTVETLSPSQIFWNSAHKIPPWVFSWPTNLLPTSVISNKLFCKVFPVV